MIAIIVEETKWPASCIRIRSLRTGLEIWESEIWPIELSGRKRNKSPMRGRIKGQMCHLTPKPTGYKAASNNIKTGK